MLHYSLECSNDEVEGACSRAWDPVTVLRSLPDGTFVRDDRLAPSYGQPSDKRTENDYMTERVRGWLGAGEEVEINTYSQRNYSLDWCGGNGW
jgi:hypothetical protein